ncbi:MAG: SDR family oxidoreductase [Myxococcota bacterium]|nr:SDR family oxidoreductase [Myxococcota bacterium]
MQRVKILITGATGYVGGRLLPVLESQGYDLRALARYPQHLSEAAEQGVEVIQGDLLDRDSVEKALSGVHTAYYLVHSMGSKADYAQLDREAALNFIHAARAARVRRVIYLGGLGDSGSELSPHLTSRQEVGYLLRSESGRVTVIELRASIVLGSGSLSFEMIRALTERLPVMVTPRWVSTLAQPIAIEDLLAYLTQCIDLEVDGNRVFEVGGRDQVRYLDLMREYARQRGLKRLMVPVPVLSPRVSSLWLGLVTPLYARIGRSLIDSVRNPTLVQDTSAMTAFQVKPMGVEQAIARALHNEDRDFAETRWSDALSASGAKHSWAGVRFGNRLVDERHVSVAARPADAFVPISQIGGDNGWYFADRLWQLRGWIDLLLGGVGMRRGRKDSNRLHPGDALDCWRVEAVTPDKLLRLHAEMRLPGRAWLQWEVAPDEHRGAVIHQTAIFDPAGFSGLAYWYLSYPFHQVIFKGMLDAIARRSLVAASTPGSKQKIEGEVAS